MASENGRAEVQARPDDLPDFDNPPVIEVVLGVQFSELRQFKTVHAGLLWREHFSAAFPDVSEHAPLEPAFETFGTRSNPPLGFQFVQVASPPLRRQWFINEAQTELIQFQPDRFIHNWRKIGEADTYPRYEKIRASFFRELSSLQNFLDKHGIGTIEPNQCEITYVNHIYPNYPDQLRAPESVFRFWTRVDLEHEAQATLPEFEDARASVRYLVRDENGTPTGRLVVNATPGTDSDGKPLIRMDLSVKGSPSETSIEGVSQFFDVGRNAIVRGFTALTTVEMHRHWRRKF